MGYYNRSKRKKVNVGKVFIAALLFIGLIVVICLIVLKLGKPDIKKEIVNSSKESADSSLQESDADFEEDSIEACASLSYYKDELKDRYITYKGNNETITYKEAIVMVNIGLDKPYYSSVTTDNDPSLITAIVNKYNSLGKYEPADLVKLSGTNSTKELYMRKEAAEHFEKMCNDARTQGYDIKAISTYRSYDRQTELYNEYVEKDGESAADTYSARPGYSEHQTGLVADIQGGTTYYDQFKSTKESKWVNKNAYKYGFIIRYPEGKQNITGYIPEAWHIRYVTTDIATKIYNDNISFDEYYAMYLMD